MPISGDFEILHRSRLTDDVFELLVYAPDLAQEACPGQFVHIDCGEGLLLRRPISICDAHQDALRLVVGLRGEGTKWLSARQPGQTINILGPLGHGYDLGGEGRVLLAGGGLGVPPLIFAAHALGSRAQACVGFTRRENVMLLDLMRRHCPVSLCTDDGSLGMHGRVDSLVRTMLMQQKFTRMLCCGPRPMLKALCNLAREYALPCQVSLEERMGCGVGACLVCACKLKSGYGHVCSDGPVFNAEEVCWDD